MWKILVQFNMQVEHFSKLIVMVPCCDTLKFEVKGKINDFIFVFNFLNLLLCSSWILIYFRRSEQKRHSDPLLWIYSMNAHNGWGWTRPDPQATYSKWGRNPNAWDITAAWGSALVGGSQSQAAAEGSKSKYYHVGQRHLYILATTLSIYSIMDSSHSFLKIFH